MVQNISLGPPGSVPIDTIYVNAVREIFTTVAPSYLVVTAAESGATVARFNLGQNVSDLTYDNQTHQVLIMSSSASELFAVNVTSLQPGQPIALPGLPLAMAFDAPTGELAVLIYGSTYNTTGMLLLLNGTASTYEVVASIPRAFSVQWGLPDYMTLDTLHQVVYVSGPAGLFCAGVQWVELGSPSVHGMRYDAGGGPVTFDPSADAIYAVGGTTDCPELSISGLSQISVFSGASPNLTGTITLNTTALIGAITDDPATAVVYAAADNGEIYAVSALKQTGVGHYPMATECPSAMSIDYPTGTVYVADRCGNELQVVSLASGGLSPMIVGGGGPSGIAFDPRTDEVVIANPLANSVSVVSLSTGQRIQIGGITEATAVVYDPVTSEVFVVGLGGVVAVLSDRSWTVTDEFALPIPSPGEGWGQVAAAFDSWTGQVFVSEFDYNVSDFGSTVYLISGSTKDIISSFTISADLGPVTAMAFDPVNGSMWLATDGDIGWVNPTTLTLDHVREVGISPLSLAYDGATRTMYVGGALLPNTSGSVDNAILGLNASTGGTVSFTVVGAEPSALVWSAATHTILAASLYGSRISIMNDTTHLIVGSPLVGSGLDAMVSAFGTGSAYAVSSTSNTLSILIPPPTFTVRFNESGLPPGTLWSVDLNGATHNSSGSSIAFAEPNGTGPFSVPNVPGWRAAPTSGIVTVNGADVGPVNIAFTPVTYLVTIEEVGLPSGTNWSVSLGATTRSSGSSGIGFELPNGSYPVYPWDVQGFESHPNETQLTVHGAPVRLGVTYEPPTAGTYRVTFVQTGQPFPIDWQIQMGPLLPGTDGAGSVVQGGPGPTHTLPLGIQGVPNGTYVWTVLRPSGPGAPPPSYYPFPSRGTVVVNGSSVVVHVTYRYSYPFYFDVQGLPGNTPVTLQIPNETTMGNGSGEYLLMIPNGTYVWRITAPGYPPQSGTVSLQGVPGITVRVVPFATSPWSSLPSWAWFGLGSVVAGAAVGGAALLGKRRHGGGGTSPEPSASPPPPR